MSWDCFFYLCELRLRKASPEEAPEAASEDSYFGQSEASGDDLSASAGGDASR